MHVQKLGAGVVKRIKAHENTYRIVRDTPRYNDAWLMARKLKGRE